MKAMARSVFLLALGMSGLSVFAQQQTLPAPADQQAKIRQAMEFFRPGITPEERLALIHPDYQQHNQQYLKYARDRKISNFQAFAEIRRQTAASQAEAAASAERLLAERGPTTPPQAPPGNTLHILYADGDVVVRVAQRWTQNPESPGSFYETFWWDIFEVRDGKLYEHWDAGLIADPNAAPNPLPPAAASTVPVVWPPARAVPTPECTATPAQVEENKRIASRFFEVGGAERLALIDENYIQHNPVFRRYATRNRVSDYETVKRGISGVNLTGVSLPAQAQTGSQPPAGNPLERVFGACDIVTVVHKVYRQNPTMPPGTFYETYSMDTFRVRNGKLVEHWDGVTLPNPALAATTAN